MRQLFTHVLDVFGKPNNKFFEMLSLFAKDEDEKASLESVVASKGENLGTPELWCAYAYFASFASVCAFYFIFEISKHQVATNGLYNQ